jgi:hypothetical protein
MAVVTSSACQVVRSASYLFSSRGENSETIVDSGSATGIVHEGAMYVRQTIPMIAMTLLAPVAAANARDGDTRVTVGAIVVAPCSVELTSELNGDAPQDGSSFVHCPAGHQPSVETFRTVDAAQAPTEPLPPNLGTTSAPTDYQLAEVIF